MTEQYFPIRHLSSFPAEICVTCKGEPKQLSSRQSNNRILNIEYPTCRDVSCIMYCIIVLHLGARKQESIPEKKCKVSKASKSFNFSQGIPTRNGKQEGQSTQFPHLHVIAIRERQHVFAHTKDKRSHPQRSVVIILGPCCGPLVLLLSEKLHRI